MNIWTIQTTPEEIGARIDAYLARCGTYSRSALVQLLDKGQVSCDGQPVGKNYRLTGHETIDVTLPDPVSAEARPENIPLDIVYEDKDLLVINKPQGLVVHPAPGHDGGTLVNALLYHCRGQLSGIGGVARPGIVHRLDKDTTGLLLAAKNDITHQALSASLQRREVSRIYKALLIGCPDPEAGVVDAPIGRHPRHRIRMAVTADGRPARTHYAVLEQFRGYSLVRCQLETGRTHQIRVHMAKLGHPVAGDVLYGARPLPGVSGQLLHACELSFYHPHTGKHLTFEAPLPQDFQNVLNGMK